MASLSLALLGSYRATLDGHSLLPLRTSKVQALLTYLAVETAANPGLTYRREHLMELLWPGLPALSSRDNLRVTLHRLRHAIPSVVAQTAPSSIAFVLADRQAVQLNPHAAWHLDVARFWKLLAGRMEQAALEQATALYMGDFLVDFYLPDSDEFEAWAANWRALLQRQMLDALDALSSLYLVQGHYSLVEGCARRQVAVDNLRESAHRQLMEALVHQGRRTEALAHYETCRQLLWEELAVEPAPETQALMAAIRTGHLQKQPSAALSLTAHTPSAAPGLLLAAALPPYNVPTRTTPFVGRGKELAALDELITAVPGRLITIVGIGGMGKTRLALRAAEQQWQRTCAQVLATGNPAAASFPDGVYFVALEALNSAPQLIFAIVQALEFSLQGERDPRQQLFAYLRPKRLLLVLDNFEQLVNEAGFLTELLTQASGLQLLVTSRERLQLAEEQVFPLGELEYQPRTSVEEASRFPAVQLLVQTAQRVRPEFTLTPADLPALARLCRAVGGLPLGIELAAAWMDTLPLAEIASQTEQSADSLETTLRHLPERHHSIRAVFNASWQRLSETEQKVFTQLAVFRGGFTREAALSVLSLANHAGVPLRHLATLVRKSLVQFEAATDRYFIHELLRQYSAEKLRQQLAGEAAAHDRHSAFFCAWLHEREADLKGAREQVALAEIETELGNVRAAWAWATQQRQAQQLAQASDALALYTEYAGLYQEAEAAFASAVTALRAHGHASQDGLALRTMVRLLIWQTLFTRRQGHFAQATEHLQHGLEVLEDPALAEMDTRAERAALAWHQAMLAYPYGTNRTAARQAYLQALALYQAVEDPWGIANTLEFLGELEGDSGNFREWLQLEEACLAIRQQLGHLRGVAHALHQVAFIRLAQGDWATSEQLMRQSLALHQQLNDRPGIAQRLVTLAVTLQAAGKFTEAELAGEQAVAGQQQLGDPFWLAIAYQNLATSKLFCGKYSEAQALMWESVRAQKEQDANIFAKLVWLALIQLACGQAELAFQALQEAQALAGQGEQWLDQVYLQLALTLIHYHRENFQQSQQHALQALQLVAEIPHKFWVIHVILAIAPLLAQAGQKQRALELSSVASYYPFFTHSQWLKDFVWTPLAQLTTDLPPAAIAAARQRGQALDPLEAAQRLRQELNKLGWPVPALANSKAASIVQN